MNENVVLTPERILEATEEVLRRFGLAKATVVDVARALEYVDLAERVALTLPRGRPLSSPGAGD